MGAHGRADETAHGFPCALTVCIFCADPGSGEAQPFLRKWALQAYRFGGRAAAQRLNKVFRR